MAKKDKKVETIDDIFKAARSETHEKLDDSFGQYDKLIDTERMNDFSLDVLQPAFDEMYKTFIDETEKQGLKRHKYVAKKDEEKLQKAAIEALLKFFEKARPSVAKSFRDTLKDPDSNLKDSIEQQYRTLATQYNIHVLGQERGRAQNPGIDMLIDSYIDNKEQTLADLHSNLYQVKSQHAGQAVESLKAKLYDTKIGTYHAPQVALHIQKKAKKKGYEITDTGRFIAHNHDALRNIYDALDEGDFGRGGPGKYHLKPKDAKSD